MKYTCTFLHPKTGERRTVIVELDDKELDDVQHNSRTADLIARGYVLRRASHYVPKGFDPDLKSIQRVQIH